jgi:hypothetical protein
VSDAPVRLVPAADVLFTEIDNETVLLNIRTERYYSLDDIGTRCWQLLSEDGDVDSLVTRLASEFNAEPATLRQDVTDLIQRLTEAGLLTPGE